MEKIHNTTIDLDYDYFEDLRHNLGITLKTTVKCDPDMISVCIDKILEDLKGVGISINGVG